jgi:hypothetical protein
MDNEAQFERMLERTRAVEQKVRRRGLLLTLIPIFFALTLLGFMYWQVWVVNQDLKSKTDQLKHTNAQLVQSTQALGQTDNELESVRKQLKVAKQEAEKASLALKEQQSSLLAAQKQLSSATAELEAANQKLKEAYAELDKVNAQKAELEEQVRELLAFPIYPLYEGWDMVAKNLYLDSRFVETLSIEISRGYHWNIDGASPDAGFNSPSFAAYVLQQADLLDPTSPIQNQTQLMSVIPIQKGKQPAAGDIIFYKGGYSLFYFEDLDPKHTPFVIGMTPVGVTTLRYDFAEIIGIGTPRYR